MKIYKIQQVEQVKIVNRPPLYVLRDVKEDKKISSFSSNQVSNPRQNVKIILYVYQRH